MKIQAFKGFSDEALLAGLFYGEARLTERTVTDELFEYIAIGQVVMNRLKSKSYPDTIQKVILQPKQFSCFNEDDPNNDKIWMFLANKRPLSPYERMLTCAILVINNVAVNMVGSAKNYVARWFYDQKAGTDHWCRKMAIAFEAGGHVFLSDGKP
jgi:hypothetical protein